MGFPRPEIYADKNAKTHTITMRVRVLVVICKCEENDFNQMNIWGLFFLFVIEVTDVLERGKAQTVTAHNVFNVYSILHQSDRLVQ